MCAAGSFFVMVEWSKGNAACLRKPRYTICFIRHLRNVCSQSRHVAAWLPSKKSHITEQGRVIRPFPCVSKPGKLQQLHLNREVDWEGRKTEHS